MDMDSCKAVLADQYPSSSPTRMILIRFLSALLLVMTVWLQMQSSPKQSQQIHDILEKRFDFRYPYRYLEEMPVKVSVSDLKKRSWQDEMELEENTLAEPDIVPLIPRFISKESQSCQGDRKSVV